MMNDKLENSDVSTQNNFDSIKDFPETLLLYVDKYVNLQLIKNTSFSGFLHSIDPITLSVILSVPCDGKYQTTVIPGHAIIDIQQATPSIDIAPPIRKFAESDEADKTQKKNQLSAWFQKNLLPVIECGDNLKIGNASVLPPYNVADICADNPVVALQVKNIMEAMPQDFVQ